METQRAAEACKVLRIIINQRSEAQVVAMPPKYPKMWVSLQAEILNLAQSHEKH